MINVVTITKEPPEGFKDACAVYRFSDSDGNMLYVGATRNPQKRIAAHSGRSKWFKMAEKVSISWHKSKEDALDAEAKAIFESKPMFNKSCAVSRVSDAYRVKTRVMVLRSKKDKHQPHGKRAKAQKPTSLAGDAIRLWCAQDGRKLGWLASKVPVASSSFSRWMTGRVIPSAVYRHRIADITGIEDLRFEEEWVSK